MKMFQKINNVLRIKRFKHNFDVIYRFVKKHPSIINKLTYKQRKKILEKDPRFIDYLNKKLLIEHLKDNPKLIEFVKKDRKQIINSINIQNILECIIFLNMNEQQLIVNNFINNSEMYKYFNQDLIINLLVNTNELVDISKCDERLQLSIVQANNKYILRCSNNVLKQCLTNNPNLIYNLDYDLIYSNIKIIKELVNNGIIERKQLFINLFSKYGMKELTQEFLIKEDFDEFKLILLGVFPKLFSIDNRKQLFKINPKVDNYWLNNDIDIIKEYIYDRLKLFSINAPSIIDVNNIDSILLVLSNNTIMENIDKEFIQEFFNNPIYDNLVKVVERVYGKECAGILKNRPKLNAKLIPTLDIFDKKVVKIFGYQTIQNFLTYQNKGFLVLESLIQDDNLLNKYIQFRNLTSDYYDNIFIDLEKQLIAFYDIKDFLLKIDLNSLNEEQKNNLLEFINDKYIDNSYDITMNLNSIEQLNNYKTMRNEMYDQQFIGADTIQKIKKILYRKYFGLLDKDDLLYQRRLNNISLIRFYNIESLIGNKQIYQFLNKNEILCLKLLLVIYKSKDVVLLKDIYLSLKNNQFVINPLYFNKIIDKLPNIYAQNIIEGLFNADNIKESNDKIIINNLNYNNNEIKCIILNGKKFNMLIHYKTFGYSNFRNLKDKTLIDRETVYESFMNSEEGMSTISCSLISDENWFCTVPRNISDGIILGFSDIEKEDIITMGPSDISLSHDERAINPISKADFNFSLDLKRKVANTYSICNNEAIRNSNFHCSYNEVGLSRRHQDISKIRNDDITGGRIMPTYIVVYDTVDEISLKTALKFKIPIVIINTKAYNLYNNYYISNNSYNDEKLIIETQEVLKIPKK